ncbi:MAG: RsmB/NOP family class I SAM-dependent RNA methyltransferase [Thermoprotei archaeon]|nr:MAG: RsmB/NOP family class I SAM-dependent RNA methyltransferase [Thermoprotei archaeon]
MNERLIIDLLAKSLYEVLNHKVSIDVAFKRACKGKCASSLNEREELYNLVRNFISDYFKIICVIGKNKRVSLKELARRWIKGLNNIPDTIPCRLSYSEWFYEKIINLLGFHEGVKLLSALNERKWWLRINTLITSEEKVLRMLDEEGVEYDIDKDYPFVVKIRSSPKPVRLLKPVKEFKAIPQDKASVMVVDVLKPEPGDVIADLASAPGLKTSLIMMLTENRSKIVAIDVSLKRLKIMRVLLKRLGVNLSNVSLVLADSRDIRVRGINKALLDAPCSNSGAIDKDPGIKIHINQGKIDYYSRLQKELLENALRLDAEEVVYATCSLMPEEGEEVISYIAQKFEFKLVKEIKWLSNGYKLVGFYDKLMRAFPHIHDTEAFFIAKIVKKS